MTMAKPSLLLVLALAAPNLHAQQQIITRLATPQHATVILLDVTSGRTLAQTGPEVLATPGSTLKPFLLLAALTAGIVRENTTVECRVNLTLDDHGHPRNFACTHPRAITVFAARDALAYSCNTYFAQLAQRMPGPVLVQTLEAAGLHPQTTPNTPESRILLTLGLEGIETTPLQLANAYRRLAQQLQNPHAPEALVRQALLDSVQYGMADNAAVPGLTLAGKTGTASQPNHPQTHGWFAGIVAPSTPTAEVLVVYIPQGSGANAAALAHDLLTELPH
jgi:cell division protein FtsI/penicillin-binding protein 2